jgi:hypothetical protein
MGEGAVGKASLNAVVEAVSRIIRRLSCRHCDARTLLRQSSMLRSNAAFAYGETYSWGTDLGINNDIELSTGNWTPQAQIEHDVAHEALR